uniref:Uncharacterized protein LOC104211908 n=1 Tax=Nicotiana sylvestris TaxID=4096 RepID=A0A1U7UYW2_NICSY|nr:PREDICTED: uncharacterized protein LOC104211908 [Nicotiana sylvestris]
MDSCNWVDTGQGRNHLSFLWFILKDLVREEKYRGYSRKLLEVHKSWSTSQVEDFQGSGNFQCVKKVFFEHIHETKDGVFFIKTHDGLTLVLCGPKQQGANQFILQELAAQGLASLFCSFAALLRLFHGFTVHEVICYSRSYCQGSRGFSYLFGKGPRLFILGSSSKRKAVYDQGSEEEEDGGSLVTRPQACRCIISDDEVEASTHHSIPLTESVETPVVILDDDDAAPAVAHDSVEQLFISGFGSASLGPVFDEAPLASFSTPVSVTPSLTISAVFVPPQAIFTTSTIPSSTIPPPLTHRAEVGSSSRSSAMRQVIIEVPTEGNLLKKSGQADVWLKPLIGPIERAKLEIHSSLTLMYDIVHASLKANLIGT